MTTQGPSRTPTLVELLDNAIQYHLEDVHTCLPGRVKEYDPAEQRAQIVPLVKRRIVAEDGEELVEEMPVIPDVPVAFPRSSEFFISFPVKPGDLGTLWFYERSVDEYLESDGTIVADATDFRRHDLTDAAFYPGMYPWRKALGDAHADNLVIGKDGGLQTHHKSAQIAIGEENPIEKVLLGTVFRTSQVTMDTALAAGWTALATIFGVLAADPAHAPVAAQLTTAQAACTATAAAVNAFESAASANQNFLSNVVLVKR